jgi:hypothetical protein
VSAKRTELAPLWARVMLGAGVTMALGELVEFSRFGPLADWVIVLIGLPLGVGCVEELRRPRFRIWAPFALVAAFFVPASFALARGPGFFLVAIASACCAHIALFVGMTPAAAGGRRRYATAVATGAIATVFVWFLITGGLVIVQRGVWLLGPRLAGQAVQALLGAQAIFALEAGVRAARAVALSPPRP